MALRKCPYCGGIVELRKSSTRDDLYILGHMCNNGSAYFSIINEDPDTVLAIFDGHHVTRYKPDFKFSNDDDMDV